MVEVGGDVPMVEEDELWPANTLVCVISDCPAEGLAGRVVVAGMLGRVVEPVARRLGGVLTYRVLFPLPGGGEVLAVERSALGRLWEDPVGSPLLGYFPPRRAPSVGAGGCLMQLNPPLPVMMSGAVNGGAAWQKGWAHGWIDYGPEAHLMWVIALDADGACWTVANPSVRFQRNDTLGRPGPEKPGDVAAAPAVDESMEAMVRRMMKRRDAEPPDGTLVGYSYLHNGELASLAVRTPALDAAALEQTEGDLLRDRMAAECVRHRNLYVRPVTLKSGVTGYRLESASDALCLRKGLVLIALADAAALASSYIGKQLGEDGEIAIETVSDVPPGHAVSMVTMREWLGSQMKLKLESRGSEIWRFQRLDPDKSWMLPPLISGVVVSSFDSERHALETIWNTYHGVGGNGE